MSSGPNWLSPRWCCEWRINCSTAAACRRQPAFLHQNVAHHPWCFVFRSSEILLITVGNNGEKLKFQLQTQVVVGLASSYTVYQCSLFVCLPPVPRIYSSNKAVPHDGIMVYSCSCLSTLILSEFSEARIDERC